MTTLFFASTSLPPCAQTSQCVQLESPVALPSAKPAGVPLVLSAWHSFRKPPEVARHRVEARRLDVAVAVDDGVAGRAHHDRAPLLAVHPVGLGRLVPAAVLVAEVVRDVGDVDELVGVLVRVLHRADDDVRTAADVGRDRRLGTHVLPAFRVDPHVDAGQRGELLGVRRPDVLVALHEPLPAQHAKLRALLRLEHVCCASASVGSNAEPPPRAVVAATPAVVFRNSRLLKSLITPP